MCFTTSLISGLIRVLDSRLPGSEWCPGMNSKEKNGKWDIFEKKSDLNIFVKREKVNTRMIQK